MSAVLLCAAVLGATTVTKAGGPFLVDEGVGLQITPSVVGLGPSPLEATGFVVVWQWGDSTEGSIYGRRFTLDKQPVGSEFTVNTVTTGRQRDPAVGALASGGFVVVWASPDEDGSGLGVYAQVYDVDGDVAKAAFLVNTDYTTLDQGVPKVLGLQAGFVVVWETGTNMGTFRDVQARVYSDDGMAAGAAFTVNTEEDNHQFAPDAALLSDGRFVVTWTSLGQDANGGGVYARVFSASGAPDGGEIAVNTYMTNHQEYSSVASLTDGGFVVAWTSNLQDGSGKGVYAQVFDSGKGRNGPEKHVNTHYKDGDQFDIEVTGLKGGGFVATLSSDGQDGSDNGVHGVLFNALYEPEDGQFEVPTSTDKDQEHSAAVPLPSGGFLVVWSSVAGSLAMGRNIHGQEFTAGVVTTPVPTPMPTAPFTPGPTPAPTPAPTSLTTIVPSHPPDTTLQPGTTVAPDTMAPNGTTLVPSTMAPNSTMVPSGTTFVPGTTLAPGSTLAPGTLSPGTTEVPTAAPSSSDDGPNTVVIVVIVVAAVAVLALAGGWWYLSSLKAKSKFEDMPPSHELLDDMTPDTPHADESHTL